MIRLNNKVKAGYIYCTLFEVKFNGKEMQFKIKESGEAWEVCELIKKALEEF